MTVNSGEFEIFRSGTRTDESNRTYFFSNEDLDSIADSYDLAKFKAPIIISHNTGGYSDRDIVNSELAYGVVEKLRREGDRLIAFVRPLTEQVIQWVKNGQILDRSASFYHPKSRNNPTPGKWYLRHVALLGATPPAVKGMTSLASSLVFAEGFEVGDVERYAITYFANAKDSDIVSFSESDSSIFVEFFQGFRDYLIDSRGLEAAERVLPRERLMQLGRIDPDRLAKQALDRIDMFGIRLDEIEGRIAQNPMLYQEKQESMSPPETENVSHPETENSAKFAEMNEEIKDLKSQNREQQRQIKSFQIDKIISLNESRLTPALLQPHEVEFKEGDRREVDFREFLQSLSPWQMGYMEGFVSRMPSQIEYGEVSGAGSSPGRVRQQSLSRTPDEFDSKSEAAHEKILAYRENHPDFTYEEVLNLPEFQKLLEW